MRCLPLSILLMTLAGLPAPGLAQMSMEQARAEGKAMGQEARANESLFPTTEAIAQTVPGYTGTDQPQSRYFGDPDGLIAQGTAQRSTHDAYRTVIDSDGSRAAFSNEEIKATAARASAIESDPDAYLEGQDISAQDGSCTPLPPGQGGTTYYEATCNIGSNLEQQTSSCTSTLAVNIETVTSYIYYTANAGPYAKRSLFEDALANGVCRSRGSFSYCGNLGRYGYTAASSCRDRDYPSEILECSQEIPNLTSGSPTYFSGIVPSTGTFWMSRSEMPGEPTFSRDGSACAALMGNSECVQTGTEVCTDSDPQTRIIDGMPVTQPCWAWEQSYQCQRISQANDCAQLAAKPECTFTRTECIDDEDDPLYDPSACKVSQSVYRCPVPAASTDIKSQYICGNDIYCINGDCEPIEREASTEFKDALVALHSIGQAGEEFDESSFTVFSGERETCHKPVFGLIDCCAGKVSGALTAAAGLGALAGGPTAIAALATPFLALLACSQDEMKLDIKDRMGFCHKVGTYCSSGVLGICKTKRTAFCCFESKLSRILQEQGRVQLAKPWGKPKKEQCEGFSIEEFSALDLSIMDFTEVYEEFIDAAKLPDEVQTMQDIQAKITNYYDLHGQS